MSIKDLSAKTLGIIALAAFAVVVAIACGVRAYINATTVEVDESVSELAVDLVEDVELSALQEALLDSYKGDDDAAEQILLLNVWESGTNTARFAEGKVAEVAADGTVSAHPFVLAQTESIDSEYAEINHVEGYKGKVYISDTPVDFTLLRSSTSDEAPYVLSCEALELTSSYNLAEKSENFTVEGLEAEDLGILSDEAKDEIADVVSAECSRLYPMATTARWDGLMEIDYDAGIISLEFRIDNPAASVTVTCSLSREVKSVEADA